MICLLVTEVIGVRGGDKSGAIGQEVEELLPEGERDTVCLPRKHEDSVICGAGREGLGVQCVGSEKV